MEAFNPVVVEKKVVGKIPFLLVYKQDQEKKPIVFLFHKILEDKTRELPLAFTLAQNGYFVVNMDMRGHGERERSYYKAKKYDFNLVFTDIYKTAVDIRAVIEYLSGYKGTPLVFSNMGTVGVSIGGSISLISNHLIDEITYAVSLMGACNWDYLAKKKMFEDFAYCSVSPDVIDYELVREDVIRYQLCNNITKDTAKPLLFQHGVWDFDIPIEGVKQYYKRLAKEYKKYGKLGELSWKQYSKAGHKVTNEMETDLINWLNQRTRE